MSRRQHLSFSIVVSLLCLALPALAGPAVTFSSDSGVYLNGAAYTLGWEFSIAAPIQVTSLGFWDYLGNGFHTATGAPTTVDVGIWNAAQSLLASTSVSGTDTILNVLADGSGFRFDTLAIPLTLQPGTYYIGGTNHGTEAYESLVGSDASYDPAVKWLSGAYWYGDTLTFPSTLDGNTPAGWFGPNFEMTGVPEPGTIGLLLLGSGLLALLGRGRRSRT